MTDTFEGMMLRSAQPLSTLTLLDGRGEVAVTITFDPPHIDLAPHIISAADLNLLQQQVMLTIEVVDE